MESLLLTVLMLTIVGTWVSALVSAVRYPAEVWRSTGRSKGAYVAVILLFGFGAGALYWILVRRHLKRAWERDPMLGRYTGGL